MMRLFRFAMILGVVAVTVVPTFGEAPEPEALGSFLGLFTPVGSGLPRGLDADGAGHLIMTELIADRVHLIDTAGNTVASPTFPCVPSASTVQGGVATDGVSFYVVDTPARQIDIYDASCQFVSSFSVAGQSTFPDGLTYNRATATLFMGDPVGSPAHLHEYSPGGVFLSSFPLAGNDVDAVGFDEARCSFWVYSSGDDQIRQYDTAANLLTSFQGPLSNIALSQGMGLGVIGNRVYLTLLDDNLIARYDITDAPVPAGCRDLFADDFESGGTSAWSLVVP